EIDLTGLLPGTPMSEAEFLPSPPSLASFLRLLPSPFSLSNKTEKALVMQYQRKMGSILYAAITTCPDITFVASRLERFNQNPGPEYQCAAARVIQYLYGTRYKAIYYGGDMEGREESNGVRLFVCASDASFADNSVDRKSSQGYVMTLFGGPIAWRAN